MFLYLVSWATISLGSHPDGYLQNKTGHSISAHLLMNVRAELHGVDYYEEGCAHGWLWSIRRPRAFYSEILGFEVRNSAEGTSSSQKEWATIIFSDANLHVNTGNVRKWPEAVIKKLHRFNLTKILKVRFVTDSGHPDTHPSYMRDIQLIIQVWLDP